MLTKILSEQLVINYSIEGLKINSSKFCKKKKKKALQYFSGFSNFLQHLK